MENQQLNDTAQLAQLQQMCEGTAIAKAGIEVLEATAERCVAKMPVATNTQPLGYLHGGASALLAETVGSIAAHLHAQPEAIAFGTDLSISHLRPVRSGYVHATASALALGRTRLCYLIEIRDEQNQLVASARLACQVQPLDRR